MQLDTDTVLREALWMVPLLVALVVALVVALIGFVGWVVRHAIALGQQFRTDVMGRLEAQDTELAEARKERVIDRQIMVDIKDLLRDEVHKLRGRLWRHEARLGRLEEHNGLPPYRNESHED